MCGIAGIVLRPDQSLPDLRQRLTNMRDAMIHRGPDDVGIYIATGERAGLVNCRLAIRDLSPSGHMPMRTADSSAWITYNGEVYNTDVLRGALLDQGYRFCSTSDTEVIVYGYRAWGTAVVKHLRGMFAFAILDSATSERSNVASFEHSNIFLARDRMGIKPLYYAQTSAGFIFASEIKALIASGLVSREINPIAVVAYLLMGSVPCPLTIYRDVQALEPGCCLTLPISEYSPTLDIQRYWHFPTDTCDDVSPAEAREQVRSLLEDAVRSHLVSDVPLGAFLSGGLDSSSVVALMRSVSNGPIRTCAMVFEEAAYSEAAYAQAVADTAGTEHYARMITAQDVVREWKHILASMDQPSIDGVNTYFVSQTAREAGLTVALSGLGGDELFGGYPNTFARIPRLFQATQMAQRIPGAPSLMQSVLRLPNVHKRWAKVADMLDRPASPASAYLACRGLFSPSEVRSLVTAEAWHAAMQCFDPVEQIALNVGTLERWDVGTFNWVSRAELHTYTHNQLLRDTDVMSMAHSLEVRVPLLDHRLVEAVLRLPAPLKQANGHGPKPLLAEAVADLLPPVVRNRRDKCGFTFPFDVWLRGPLRSHDDGQSAGLRGMLREEQVVILQRMFESDKLHWSRPWALAVLYGWAGAVAS